MSFHIVRFEDVKPQPWKNGGGVTRELLAWPNSHDWVMRLSVADIECDGPFSAFPGIDRWFAVLSGNGVRLGMPAKTIRRADDVLHFDGALAPDCALVDGLTRDLNLMIRRDAASGWMKRVQVGFEFPIVGQHALKSGVATTVNGVFTVDGCTLNRPESTEVIVEPMSLIWSNDVIGAEPWATTDCDDASLLFGFQCVLLK